MIALILIYLIAITYQLQPTCKKINSKLIHDLLPTNQQIFSGYLPINDQSESKIAFIFYGAQLASNLEQLNNYSTLIWLNGGPGTSSQLGNYIELGPIIMNEQGKLSYNIQSWNLRYNLIFVDQPIGVGYSYAAIIEEIPDNMDQVSSHFNFALKSLIQACQFATLSQQSKWYFAGESYAGKYIPAIVYDIVKTEKWIINLKGIIMGNPWTDPLAIITELTSYSYHLGLIDLQDRQYLERMVLKIVKLIQKEKYEQVADNIELFQTEFMARNGGINYFNIRKTGTYAKHNQLLEQYLNQSSIKDVLGFNQVNYTISQNQPNKYGNVYKKLRKNMGQRDVTEKLEYLLSQIPILIYNGQNDATCTNGGTQKWVNRLIYKNSLEFNNKNFTTIQLLNKTIGYEKQAGNLKFVIVNDAGHMVPLDKPTEIFDIIQRFVD